MVEGKKESIIRVSAPGKVILHGEHAVVHYKPAVAVSVALFTNLEVTRSEDFGHKVTLKFEGIGLDVSISLEDARKLQEKLGPSYRYGAVETLGQVPLEPASVQVISEFIKSHVPMNAPSPALASAHLKASEAFLGLYLAIFDEKLEPLTFTVTTELPVGSGLGSSASFAVALAAGMLIATGRISSTLSSAEDKRKVNRWAYFSEKFVHGSPSGIDNYVTTYGGAVLFQRQVDGQPDKVEAIKCPEIRALLVDTKVPRSTHSIIQKTNKMKEEEPQVWQTIMNDIGVIVETAVADFRQGNVNPQHFTENHKLLQRLGVSHEALDRIVDLAKAHGFSGKLTGAGGGGCAFVFIPETCDERETKVNALKESLTSAGFSFWDTKLSCVGVQTVPNVTK